MKKIKKIKIKVNGKLRLIKKDSSALNIIKNLKIPLKKVAIELNQEIVDKKKLNKIQDSRKSCDGIIINAAGYTHTSVSIRDALDIFKKPIIELHISNIYKREEFRHKSYLSGVVTGIICGLGSKGYIFAINAMHELLNNGNR